jgi:hypothetical protein
MATSPKCPPRDQLGLQGRCCRRLHTHAARQMMRARRSQSASARVYYAMSPRGCIAAAWRRPCAPHCRVHDASRPGSAAVVRGLPVRSQFLTPDEVVARSLTRIAPRSRFDTLDVTSQRRETFMTAVLLRVQCRWCRRSGAGGALMRKAVSPPLTPRDLSAARLASVHQPGPCGRPPTAHDRSEALPYLGTATAQPRWHPRSCDRERRGDRIEHTLRPALTRCSILICQRAF